MSIAARPADSVMASPGPIAPSRSRVEAVDVVRGIIMILMALDHTRDYFGNAAASPTNLATTTVALQGPPPSAGLSATAGTPDANGALNTDLGPTENCGASGATWNIALLAGGVVRTVQRVTNTSC